TRIRTLYVVEHEIASARETVTLGDAGDAVQALVRAVLVTQMSPLGRAERTAPGRRLHDEAPAGLLEQVDGSLITGVEAIRSRSHRGLDRRQQRVEVGRRGGCRHTLGVTFE